MLKPDQINWNPAPSAERAVADDGELSLEQLVQAVTRCGRAGSSSGMMSATSVQGKHRRDDTVTYDLKTACGNTRITVNEKATEKFIFQAFRDGWTGVHFKTEISNMNSSVLSDHYVEVTLTRVLFNPGVRSIPTYTAAVETRHNMPGNPLHLCSTTKRLDAQAIWDRVKKSAVALRGFAAKQNVQSDPETLKQVEAMARLGSASLRDSDRVEVDGDKSNGSGINPLYRNQ